MLVIEWVAKNFVEKSNISVKISYSELNKVISKLNSIIFVENNIIGLRL